MVIVAVCLNLQHCHLELVICMLPATVVPNVQMLPHVILHVQGITPCIGILLSSLSCFTQQIKEASGGSLAHLGKMHTIAGSLP